MSAVESPSDLVTHTDAVIGTNLGGINLGGTNLGGTNLGGTNLGGINLGGTNLGGTNLGGTNLGGTNLGGTNLGGSNLGGSNLGGSNLGGTNLGGSNLGGSNLGGTNIGGNNLGGTNLGDTNLAGTDSGANIHNLTGTVGGMLYSREDQWLPKTGQCIVMGLGSTAFAKLLGQQSANAKISVALGKLPWGFANTAGGPVALSAWEAIVWGDKTYCSFVLGSPTSTSWAGMAGFIKAIFRWNAPPTQSMDISGIEASALYSAPNDPTLNLGIATYTGMANAAAQFRAGKITEKNFVAGELPFVTATTNNQRVEVDFSAWVMDSTKLGLVLANVESTNKPTRAEAVYYATENADGTIAVGTWFADANGPPSGMTDTNRDLDTAYNAWTHGTGPKPIPMRCSGALYLNRNYLEPMPAGKCDNGLTWATNGPSMYRFWSSVAGTTAPFNGYMTLPYSTVSPVLRPDVAGNYKTVLSETYIHMWDPAFDLNRAAGGRASASGTICNTTSQTAAKAFDNLMTPTNGTEWCVNSAPTPSAPVSVMISLPSSYAINSYTVTAGDVAASDPAGWALQGCSGSCTAASDTGWVTLDTRSAQSFGARWQINTYSFTNATSYNKYRLRITANNGSTTKTQVGELQLISTTPQSDAALCASIGKNCGSTTAVDNVGSTRSIASCGTCTSPNTCGGRGVPNVCGGGATPSCNAAYAQSNCLSFSVGSQVSKNGHAWTCSDGACRNCATNATCAPGGTGCPWGVTWQDNGPCL